MNGCQRLLSIMVAVLMLTVSIGVPMVASDSSADPEQETYILSMVPEDSIDTEYGVIPVVMVGYTLGQVALAALAGFAAGYIVNELVTPAGENEDYYKQLRELKGGDLAMMVELMTNTANTLLPADADLWSFTSSYWNRAVELIVSELWSETEDYDPNPIVDKSLLRDNLQNYIYDWQSAMDKGFASILDIRESFTGDCWGDMVESIQWSGGRVTATSDADTPFYLDLTQIVKGAQSGQRVYIDGSTYDAGGTYATSTSGTIYNLGTTTVTMIKESVYVGDLSGTRISIEPGKTYTISDSESGLYRFETSNATIGGPLSMAASDDAATVYGGMVINGGSQIVYALPNGNNLNVGVAGSTTSYNSNYLRVVWDYTGESESQSYRNLHDGSTNFMIRDWNNLIQQINEVVSDAATAGQTIWEIFDAAEESNSFISPSSISMTLKGMDMTADQQKAIYIQALGRVADYWDSNGAELKAIEYDIDATNTDLIVYGDIYFNGTLWMEDAIFTPYLAVSESQRITVGEECDWKGAGYAMVWGQEDSYHLWDGSRTSADQYLLNLGDGYSIVAEKILDDGVEVDTITLEPTIIERYSTDVSSQEPLPDAVRSLDASTLVMIILFELAVILFLLGYMGGQPVYGAVAAIVVIVVALLCSDLVARILSDMLG